MKKVVTILITILITCNSISQDWIEFNASESTLSTYDVSKSLDTIVEFEIIIPGMFSTVIDSFNRVFVEEYWKLDSVGYPEVPIIL